MRRAALGLLLLPTLTSVAAADTLTATREQPMLEVSHTVDVRLEDGVAIMHVRRQFANPGKVADEAGLAIDLPTGAAATGLRIRAHDRWYDGELMEREAAAALYHEMTGLGAYKPKDPALLQWLWADKLYLQVFPVMPGEVSTVEYTLTVPTRYTGGRYWVSYPRLAAGADSAGGERGLALATPVITIHPAWGTAQTPIFVDGKRAAPDTAIVLVPPVHQAWEAAVGADDSASYVASTIEVPADARTKVAVTQVKLDVAIHHTYKSDLRVELLAPDGQHVTLFDRKGGGDNNIIQAFDAKLAKPVSAAGTWRLVVSDHAGLDNGSIDKFTLHVGDGANATTVAAGDLPIFVPDAPENGNDAGLASIAVAAPPIAQWTGRLGRAVASSQHAFGRLEVDVAPQLVPLPKRAQVVFAIDTSFSGGAHLVDAQLAIVRAYVAHVPDAEVEIIGYQRHAKPVFGRFVTATDLPAAIAAARAAGAFALGNGSALDEAAQLATKLLAARHAGPRRLVLTGDHLLRTSLAKPGDALAKLPADVVVHVVTPHPDDGDDRVALERVDTDDLAPLATKHHGIYAELAGVPVPGGKTTDKDLTPVALELVRPTRIEQLAVTGGYVLDGRVLHEGEALRLTEKATAAGIPAKSTLTGLLWSDPIKKELAVGDAFSRATAAWVFGEDDYHDLSHEEQLKIAFAGRAVSPVTSYVAAEPGTRPSTIGLPGYGTSGFGAGGGGMGSGYGLGSARRPPNFAALVGVDACVAAHKPPLGWHVAFDVETTRDEVVDVQLGTASAGGGANEAAFASCLVDAVWAVRLDAAVFSLTREAFHFQLK